MRIGSLFSGIGGLELGLERAGLGHVVWQVEIDPWCREVLAKHWPDADRSVHDVGSAGASTLAPVDLICGGFPCQDVSAAGLGRGLDGDRSGLWREFLRVVEKCRPGLVVVENVASGAKSWLPAVRHELQDVGYRTRAFAIGASDVGAPHLRRRIFVVGDAELLAYPDGEPVREQPRRRARVDRRRADPGGVAELGGRTAQPALGVAVDGLPDRLARRSVVGGTVDLGGLGHRWPAGRDEAPLPWEAPRSATRVSMSAEKLAALGNAVVPQCAEVVGRIIVSAM